MTLQELIDALMEEGKTFGFHCPVRCEAGEIEQVSFDGGEVIIHHDYSDMDEAF